MTKQEIDEKTRAFLVDELEIEADKIKPEARLKEDIGIDSLDFVDIVVIVERVFGFKIKVEDVQKIKTYSQFCDYIETHIEQ